LASSAGLLWRFPTRMGLGRLPRDVVIQRDHVTFYFPIVTCLLLKPGAQRSLLGFQSVRHSPADILMEGEAIQPVFCLLRSQGNS
jgi:hypothetical protein